MPQIMPGGDVHARFAILAGLIRHEYWLHAQRPEDHKFVADPDSLTLRALKQDGDKTPCFLTLTEETLQRDLHILATEFFKEACEGQGSFARRARRRN